MELTIEGKSYINGEFIECCIGIEKGKIKTIKKILKSDEHICFKKSLILPAGIDPHVHFRDPGMTYKEDFSTGSMAAAYAGVTCVADMPNTKPPTTTVKAISEKIRTAGEKTYIDYGILLIDD